MKIRKIDKKAILAGLKSFCTKNVALKAIALVFAVLLWGYVLTDQKPMRTKIIPEVATSFDGEAELIAQGFCIRGNREEILQKVAVTVRTQITNYAYVNAGSISATISLRNISEAREYEIPIQANVSSALGVVQTVSPSSVKVQIDTLVTKTIPVTTSFTGELPNGYWADTDALTSTTRLDVTGAKTDISNITRAECVVDLNDKTSTIYSTFDVTMYDKDNNVVSSDILVGTLPSSTVRLPIYPMKSVPIDVLGSLVGTDDLAKNHEIVNAVATPATVRIVGEQSVLDAIDSILLTPIAVNELNTTSTVESDLILPDGVRLLDSEKVSVLIEIQEMQMSQLFEQLEVQIVGTEKRANVTLDVSTVDLTVEGRYSLVSVLMRKDITVQVDVTGLAPGVYKLPLNVLVRDEAATVELTTTLSVTEVTVTITQQ